MSHFFNENKKTLKWKEVFNSLMDNFTTTYLILDKSDKYVVKYLHIHTNTIILLSSCPILL